MRGWFSYDGVINRVLSKAMDCMYLSLLWIVCCIPLFTVGAATTALYYTVNKVVRYDKSGIWREYWHSFRLNFKQATVIWLILLLLYGLLITSCYAAYQLYIVGQIPKIMLIFLIALVAVLTMWAIYLFPYLARFNNTTRQLMKNCGWFMLMNFVWSVLLFAIFVAVVVCSLFVPMGFVVLPSVGMLACNYILEIIFRRYMAEEDLAVDNERNRISSDKKL